MDTTPPIEDSYLDIIVARSRVDLRYLTMLAKPEKWDPQANADTDWRQALEEDGMASCAEYHLIDILPSRVEEKMVVDVSASGVPFGLSSEQLVAKIQGLLRPPEVKTQLLIYRYKRSFNAIHLGVLEQLGLRFNLSPEVYLPHFPPWREAGTALPSQRNVLYLNYGRNVCTAQVCKDKDSTDSDYSLGKNISQIQTNFPSIANMKL
jgi:hypothetical protein